MISSQVRPAVDGFDERTPETDDDVARSGLRMPSLIRRGRLAVVASDALASAAGEVGSDRLARIRGRLSEWIRGAQQSGDTAGQPLGENWGRHGGVCFLVCQGAIRGFE